MIPQWIAVKVHPRAKKSLLVGLGPGRFEAWVRAKTVEGQANDEVTALLARAFQISPHCLRLVKGSGGTHKVFHVLG